MDYFTNFTSEFSPRAECTRTDWGYATLDKFITCSPLSPYLPLFALSLMSSFLFYMLAIIADGYLCPAVIHLSKKLGLSDSVAGATLVAFGNGAPDMFSALSGVRHNRTSMVFTQLFGSGAFVTIMVSGLVMFFAPPFTVDVISLSRDIFFYLTGSIFTFYVFYRHKVHLLHAVAFVGIYVVYIVVIAVLSSYQSPVGEAGVEDESVLAESGSVYSCDSGKTSFTTASLDFIMRMRQNRSDISFTTNPIGYGTFGEDFFDSSSESIGGNHLHFVLADLVFHVLPWTFAQFRDMKWWTKLRHIFSLPIHLVLRLTVPVVNDKKPRANWCKLLNTIHAFASLPFLLYLYGANNLFTVYGIPILPMIMMVTFGISIAVFFLTKYSQPPIYHSVFAVLGFATATAWIYTICETLVTTISSIGGVLGIPQPILGMTALAWGNCIGDLVTGIAIARNGFASMALSALFGGALLEMLLGLGIPYLILLMQNPDSTIELDWTFTFLPAFVLILVMHLASLIMLWTNRWKSSEIHGAVFIAGYLIMLITAVAISFAEAKGLLEYH